MSKWLMANIGYILRNINLISSISKKNAGLIQSNHIRINRKDCEIFVPYENYKKYTIFLCSNKDFLDDMYWLSVTPLDYYNVSNAAPTDSDDMYISVILPDYKLLDEELVLEIENTQEKHKATIANEKIQVFAEERNGIVNFYYFVNIEITSLYNMRLKFKSLDFTDQSLNVYQYEKFHKCFKDKGCDIEIEDIYANIKEAIMQFKLLDYWDK